MALALWRAILSCYISLLTTEALFVKLGGESAVATTAGDTTPWSAAMASSVAPATGATLMAPAAISFAPANNIVGTIHGQGVQTLNLEGIKTKPAKSLDADPYS